MMVRRMVAFVSAFGGALALAVSAASAHAHLEKASPAGQETVAAPPAEIDLTFSEGVDLAFTGITVTGPGGALAKALGTPHLAAGSDRTVVVPVTGTLAPGSYVVDWHVLSRDGHKTHGSYAFTVGQ